MAIPLMITVVQTSLKRSLNHTQIGHTIAEVGLNIQLVVGQNGRPSQGSFYIYMEKNVQGLIQDLDQWKMINKQGKKTLTDLGLHICHIMSWADIKKNMHDILQNNNTKKLECLVTTLWPTIEQVESGESIFGGGNEEQKCFLTTYKDNDRYERYAEDARHLVASFDQGKLDSKKCKTLDQLLFNAPANLRLGDAKRNMSIKQHLDYNPMENRSVNLKKQMEDGGMHLTPYVTDDKGVVKTSFYQEPE